MTRLRAVAVLLALLAGCSKRDDEPRPPAQVAPEPPASAVKGPMSRPLVLARGVRFVKPAGGDAAAAVRKEILREAADGRSVIVYVGATWCEPCQRFHEAAKLGKLDEEFPSLTFVEFDADEDKDRIAAAGYRSAYIPLFVKPGPDGRATDVRFQGSVKGPQAIGDITEKLKKLLSGASP